MHFFQGNKPGAQSTEYILTHRKTFQKNLFKNNVKFDFLAI